MKLVEIFRFEAGYQLRRPPTWLIGAALFGLLFAMTRDGLLAEALREEFFMNSPFAIAKNLVMAVLVWLLVGVGVAGSAAARDVATRMDPLVFTTPLSKLEYLGGRFLAALAVNLLLLLVALLSIWAAAAMPGLDPVVVGPTRPWAYASGFLIVAAPGVFVGTALQFALAARSGRPMAGYLASVGLFLVSWIVAGIVYSVLGRPPLGRALDAVGAINVVQEMSLLWTPAEKSTRLVTTQPYLLWNRLLWIAIGGAGLVFTYGSFRFRHRGEREPRRLFRRRSKRRATAPPSTGRFEVGARGRPKGEATPAEPVGGTVRSGAFLDLRRILLVARTSAGAVLGRWSGLAATFGLLAVAVVSLSGQLEMNGVPLAPTTARILTLITAPLANGTTPWMFIPLLVVFFAGELVWRERETGIDPITDAMPASAWVPLVGKLLGIAVVLTLWLAALMAGGLLVQALEGYTPDVRLYATVLFGLQLPEYLLFAVLAVSLHVLANHKYVGHLLALLAYAFIVMPAWFGVEHTLLVFGAAPPWTYTEMRGFGSTLVPWAWFELYWGAAALVLAVVARLFWARGVVDTSRGRIRAAARRMRGPTLRVAGGATALWLGLGGYLFYNTNVLNAYRTSESVADARAAYEVRYGRYQGAAQPRVAATSLDVRIFPSRSSVAVRGAYGLLNDGPEPIDTLHVATFGQVETGEISFDRPGSEVVRDDELGHRIYALSDPLAPGDTLTMAFDVRLRPRGIGEDGIPAAVAAKASYFTSLEWLPRVGYQPERELTGGVARRARGLPPRPAAPPLETAASSPERVGSTTFEAVVSTAPGQVAVAPGVLESSWIEDGRPHFRYVSAVPIGSEYPVASAEYAIHGDAWNDVAIRIYHHPGHDRNLERMVESVRASLDYYTEHFGPYRYGQVTFVEHPGHGVGMHADPSVITYEEGFAAFRPGASPRAHDLPFYVVAHEMAHQWTVPYAYVEGASVLTESLATFSALQVVEQALGRNQLLRHLEFMRRPHPYPPIRRGKTLMRAEDPYLGYRKGPFALRALAECGGRDAVNGAIRRLLETHRRPGARPATTLDLYRSLEAALPASARPLLRDLFTVNTYWDLAVERVSARETQEGRWEVTMAVKARKSVVDSAGVETDVPMEERVQVGAFGPAEPGAHELSNPLYLSMHTIRSGAQTLSFVVDQRPVLAGIDPDHLLDWEEQGDDDNVEPVG